MAKLGNGAYGSVHEAIFMPTGDTVAIKSVNKETIMKLDKRRHIFREKSILSSLDHPYIIKLLGTAQDEENLYFIFEHCSRGTLYDLL